MTEMIIRASGRPLPGLMRGMIFSDTKLGVWTERATPDDPKATHILLNPVASDYRMAAEQDVMCDQLIDTITHELAHAYQMESRRAWMSDRNRFADDGDLVEPPHDQEHSYLWGWLNRSVVPHIRKQLREAFRESGAWRDIRKLNRLPLREGPAPELKRLTHEQAEALTTQIDGWSDVKQAKRWVIEYATNREDPVAAVEAVSNVLDHLHETGVDSEEERQELVEFVAKLGIDWKPSRKRPLANDGRREGGRSAEATYYEIDALRRIRSGYYMTEPLNLLDEPGTPESSIYDLPEVAGEWALSPAQIATLIAYAHSLNLWVDFEHRMRPLHEVRRTVIDSISDGEGLDRTVKQLLDEQMEYVKEYDREAPPITGKDAEAAVMLAVLMYLKRLPNQDVEDPMPGFRQALKELVTEGKLGRVGTLKQAQGPRKRRSQNDSTQRSLL
jgi:hypothetical protein